MPNNLKHIFFFQEEFTIFFPFIYSVMTIAKFKAALPLMLHLVHKTKAAAEHPLTKWVEVYVELYLF